jgi:hypothetical protein
MNPITRKLTALTAVGALALGAAGTAQAKHGADDPAGHKRHGADDVQPHHKHGADDGARHHRRHHGHKRHGHGRDDGPNHR